VNDQLPATIHQAEIRQHRIWPSDRGTDTSNFRRMVDAVGAGPSRQGVTVELHSLSTRPTAVLRRPTTRSESALSPEAHTTTMNLLVFAMACGLPTSV
jgi:hypothetical protein